MKDPLIVVTGANGAIGSAICRALAKPGVRMALIGQSPDPAESIADLVDDELGSYYSVNVADHDRLAAVMEDAAQKMGGISQLITSAGVTSFGSSQAISLDEWQRVIGINLSGVFWSCQKAIPHIIRNGSAGRIINIGSILAKNGGNARPWLDASEQDRASNVAYGSAKAGVHAMTKYLAKELASHGTTVNCVAPGPTASAMTKSFPDVLKQTIPMGRMASAEDVANVVKFLCSEQASYLTGEIIDVNGGMLCD